MGVTLGSAGLYDLDMRYIPDVLSLRARRPEAAVVKVMSRKDNWLHVPWSSRGAGVTLGSAGLYDLDMRYIPDVLSLRARWPEAAVVKVMSRKDNRCVRVLIPDENVGHQEFHDVLLHDMANADVPYVAVIK